MQIWQWEENGTWGSKTYARDGAYVIPKIETELKQYYVENENYADPYGHFPQGILLAPLGWSTGVERFFVMALKDYSHNGIKTSYSWNGKYTKVSYTLETNLVVELGTGKENTAKLMNESALTSRTDNIWNYISTEVNKGWYLPSRAEFCAFNALFNVYSENYESLRLV